MAPTPGCIPVSRAANGVSPASLATTPGSALALLVPALAMFGSPQPVTPPAMPPRMEPGVPPISCPTSSPATLPTMLGSPLVAACFAAKPTPCVAAPMPTPPRAKGEVA